MVGDDREVRVILVGSTGLDVSLRRLPGVEIERARGTLDAVGCLSVPLGGAAAIRNVVILGSDAHREARHVFGSTDDELVDGLRVLAPGVRVLLMLDAKDRLPEPELVAAYDGFITREARMDELIDIIRGGLGPVPTGSASASSTQTVSQAAVGAMRRANDGAIEIPHRTHAEGDARLVSAMLSGIEILPPALDMIRRRTGDAGVRFEDSASTVLTDSGGMDQGGGESARPGSFDVRAGDRVVGVLISDTVDAGLMRAQADWLGEWMRLQEQQRQLQSAAFTDALTGAWNRRYFDRFLAIALDQARESRRPLTLLLFDIDDFKRFNERYGHSAADDILIETVRLMRSVIRPSDRVCRIGGDEFAVIFHEPAGPRTPGSKPPESVSQIAERFQRQIRERRFPKLGIDAPGELTVSGGLATFPWDGTTCEQLVQRADDLARQSKRDGKNAIRLGPGAIEHPT
jgi:diguanylate cyclase (GGDEF)-like protein